MKTRSNRPQNLSARIAEIVELDMQLDANGKVEAYRSKVKLSFKYEGS